MGGLSRGAPDPRRRGGERHYRCGAAECSDEDRASAHLALAALPGFVLPGDTSASARYARDITLPFELDADGCIAVPTGPGIGVEVIADELTAVTDRVVALVR